MQAQPTNGDQDDIEDDAKPTIDDRDDIEDEVVPQGGPRSVQEQTNGERDKPFPFLSAGTAYVLENPFSSPLLLCCYAAAKAGQ